MDVSEIHIGGHLDNSKLFSFGIPILKVVNVQNGKINTQKLIYLGRESCSSKVNKFLLHPQEVCITISGDSSGKIAIKDHNQSFYVSSTVCFFKTKEQITSRYLLYALNSVRNEIQGLVRGGAVKGLPINQLGKIKIPLPSLEIQNKIVNVLDLFRTICEPIKGIPEKIQAIKKSYQHYLALLMNK